MFIVVFNLKTPPLLNQSFMFKTGEKKFFFEIKKKKK